jgi:hypothetical protein
MHGHSEEDYQRELAKAKAEDNAYRIAVLMAAHDIVDHCDYEHIHTVANLKILQTVIKTKIGIIEGLHKLGKLNT